MDKKIYTSRKMSREVLQDHLNVMRSSRVFQDRKKKALREACRRVNWRKEESL